MDKKLQVFVSSTYTDLIEERQAAVEAILDAGHIPAGMELFKAGKSQMQTIQKWIDESDVYILMLGGRYGSIEEESGLSYTELEYKYAISKSMPVFAIVLEDSFLFTKAASCGKSAVFETDNPTKYETFKKYVKTNVVKFASNIYQISAIIHSHLNEILNDTNYNLVGWVRSNKINNYVESPYNKFYQYLKEAHSALEGFLLNIYTYRERNNYFENDWNKLAISFYKFHAFCQINHPLLDRYVNDIESIKSYWNSAVMTLSNVYNNPNDTFYPEAGVELQNSLEPLYNLLSKILYNIPNSNIT